MKIGRKAVITEQESPGNVPKDNDLTEKQAVLLNESLRHFLKNCATNCTVAEALMKIKKIPKKFWEIKYFIN